MIFDVLVIGETPAAMSSAALLARKGLKVAWILPVSKVGEESPHGLKVPDVMWDLLPQTLVRHILSRLGVPYKHLEKSEKRGSGLQLVAPEFRTGFLDGVGELRRELKRIFAVDSGDLEKIFPKQRVSDEDFLQRYWGTVLKDDAKSKRTSRLSFLTGGESLSVRPFGVEGMRVGPELRRFFELVFYSQSYIYQWIFPTSLVRHFAGNLANLNIFAQGRLVSPERIFQEVFHMGEGVLFKAGRDAVLELHQEKGISLWLGKDEVVNGTLCLVTASPQEIPSLYEGIHLPRRWFGREKGEEGGYRLANILFSIDARGIPGGMGENLLLYLAPATEPFTPSDLACLSFERTGDPAEIEGHLSVFYEGEVPQDHLDVWAHEQIKRLEGLFPFMVPHIEVKSVFLSQESPMAVNHYYYSSTRKRRLGSPWMREGGLGKNLYFIGRRQLDYLGLEGEIITSLKAYHWVLDRLSKL